MARVTCVDNYKEINKNTLIPIPDAENNLKRTAFGRIL